MSDTIKESVTIFAPRQKVWQMLVTPYLVKEWASAFSEGSYVESDFQSGGAVVWRTKDGEPGAVGKVTERKEETALEVTYYEELNPDLKGQPGKYKESYVLTSSDDSTTLSITAGPLSREHLVMHQPLWVKALETMKSFAEQAMSMKGMDA